MRHAVTTALAAALVAVSVPAQAQDRVFTEPYWTTRPVIEAIGQAVVEFAPNRAFFNVTFEATGDTAQEATRSAADNARRGIAAINARVPTGVRIATQVGVQALYEQYRDRDGNRIDNERPDQISGYVARVTLQVTIDDAASLGSAGEARAAAMAAGPQNTSQLSYTLVTTPQMRQQVYAAAVADAHARAQAAASATGRRLGPLLVAQDGRGPCLGQWTELPAGVQRHGQPTEVQSPASAAPPPPPGRSADSAIVVTGTRRGEPAITLEDIAALNLPADPNPLPLQTNVCLVYASE